MLHEKIHTFSILTFIFALIGVSITSKTVIEDKCRKFSFDKCQLDANWVISNLRDVSNENECQKACMDNSRCTFYIHIAEEAKCQLLGVFQESYLDTCDELGQPKDVSIQECKDSNDPCKVQINRKSIYIYIYIYINGISS